MTEAIDFNQLKSAFTRNARHEAVRSLSPQQLSQPLSTTLQLELAEVSAVLRRTKIELTDTQQKLAISINEHEKSLRYVRTLSEEKIISDTVFARFHEDKMRMHRTLRKKTAEIEQLKKQINANDILQKRMKTKITQIKENLVTTTESHRATTDQLATISAFNDKLMSENNQLKKQQQPAYILKHWAIEKAKTTFAYIGAKAKNRLKKSKTETTALTWVPAKKALPKRQCLVFVRNESESDIAIFYPQTRSFKCAKKNIRVTEWALSR